MYVCTHSYICTQLNVCPYLTSKKSQKKTKNLTGGHTQVSSVFEVSPLLTHSLPKMHTHTHTRRLTKKQPHSERLK